MHIKSLIIDGFKSYGKRVELNDFDPEFNAITGLNGTGKSNILDAICFALGITTMNTIRATTMQDVIYKSGQAGVQTASVMIKFDNKDKSKSPPYYTQNDEIVVSREVGMNSKNTYSINGVIVTAKKIMEFFNTLHMNVNNPHFIIMQGRIMKVLNMKPIEILSLVEEAAGTNMYKIKKINLENTVSRKDGILRIMEKNINEEILPTLKIIEEERQMMEELNMVDGQLRNLKEKLDSFNYMQLMDKLKESQDKCEMMNKRNKEKLDFVADLKDKINQTRIYLNSLLDKTDQGCKNKLNEIKARVSEVEKKKYSIENNINGCESSIKSEEKRIKNVEKQISNDKKNLDLKKKEMEDFHKVYGGLEEENQKNKELLNNIDKKIRLLNSGNIYTDEDNGSVQENVRKFNLELQNQQTENQICIIKVDGLKNKLNEHLTGMKEAQKTYDMQIAQLEAKEKEYEKVKNEYLKANEESSHHTHLIQSRNSLFRDIRDLSLKVESFESNYPSLFFRYNDPWPNFDRRRVPGLVCRLFKPVDFKYELALTTLAGGKLYFVVTQDDETVSHILDTNKFPNRINFIPLNIIEPNVLSQDIIKIAQQIGGVENVFPALSLIKFDKIHLKAMHWVFGQAFVCTNKEIAEKVCFDYRVKKHCFTLEGDHFNPSGSLTGGANIQRLILQVVANQDVIITQLQEKNRELAQFENRLALMANLPNKVAQLADRQLMVQEELEKIKLDVHLGQPYQQVTEVNNIKQQIADLEKKLMEGKFNEKQLSSKIIDLESKMNNAENILKQQLNEAKNNRKNVFVKLKSNEEEYKMKKNIYNKLELEVKYLTSQMEADKNRLAKLNTEKCRLEGELNVLKSTLDEVNQKFWTESKKLKDAEEELRHDQNKINEVNDSIKNMNVLIEETEIFLLDYKGQIKKAEEKQISNQKCFDELNNKLSDDQKHIAPKLDYTNFVPSKCKQMICNLQSRFDELSKVVDPGKLNNFQKHVREFKKLKNKLDTVMKDREKIREILKELDVKKNVHLQRASERVNIEFAKIFSCLLPGAQACLRQVNPNNINAGLEIRVAFNGLWKESLDELSGGQRSLVALSLVLAMLLFNPVPLYIFDEIDAALDLAHTQNIGKMLKQHFKQSQFIIVSLKDGMFSNANVLFRTQFVDGSSAITRTTTNLK